MSATIGINNSKFVIFGSGHDYTLADSGEGEKVFFSHPYVPLNGINYAGQYYFLAPVYDPNDETAEPVITDVVKDDIAHCTFTPALGTAFDTEGEIEIKVKYRREYVYQESTILVEKELSQTITVVDHGTVASSYSYWDNYTDGYVYIHPNGNNIGDILRPIGTNGTKVSSLPWRQTSLGNLFTDCRYLTDLDELRYADTSNVDDIGEAFSGCESLVSLNGLDGWDVSKVFYMYELFKDCYALEDISALEKWNTSAVTHMGKVFHDCNHLADISALENWDVSEVDNMSNMFEGCGSQAHNLDLTPLRTWKLKSNLYNLNDLFNFAGMTSLDGLDGWDVSKVRNISNMFKNCHDLTDISAIAGWNVSEVRNMSHLFDACWELADYSPIKDWNTSKVTNMSYMFDGSRLFNNHMDGAKLHDVDFLKDWDVSNVIEFTAMFSCQYWLSDLSGIKDWVFPEARNFSGMFWDTYALLSLSDLSNWDMSAATNIQYMFQNNEFGFLYAALPDEDVISDTYGGYYDIDGNYIGSGQTGTLTEYHRDASGVSGWTINITSPTNAFQQNDWDNIPSWN